MSKAQYILLVGIIGLYGLLFVTLVFRALSSLRRSPRREVVSPQLEKISRVVARARQSRAWTRAVWRGTLAHEAH
ncbi:MAG: hypothetical protein JO360_17990 [Acidobacteria bacterium]|nr:hypothetical protein [Acidobacteriota bacterium]